MFSCDFLWFFQIIFFTEHVGATGSISQILVTCSICPDLTETTRRTRNDIVRFMYVQFTCSVQGGTKAIFATFWYKQEWLILNIFSALVCFFFYVEFECVPAGIYLFKTGKRNTRAMYEICSKVTIKTPERCQLRRSGVFIVLTLNRLHTLF